MNEFNKECGTTAALAVYLFMAGTSCFFLGMFLSNKFSRFFKWLLNLKSNTASFQKDIMEMKKTTNQIVSDWNEMTKLIAEIQDYQAFFVEHLRSEFQDKCDTLGKKINDLLKREVSKNEDRMKEILQNIEAMREDISSTKMCLNNPSAQRSDQIPDGVPLKKGQWAPVTSNAAQTVGEVKKRVKDGRTKISTNTEYDVSKFSTMVKMCLADLMKDAKHQLSVDREDETKELQLIFTKLAEDREDIKRTIVQAFAVAADQAKKSFDQSGITGQEAMGYVATLNEDTNKMLNAKLGNANDRLNEILNTVKRQNYDVVSIRGTLENIDGQFDEIFRRIELGCQSNTEQCEAMAENLEKASRNWQGTASELEKVTKEFSKDSRKMRDMLKEIKSLLDSEHQRDLYTIPEKTKGKHKMTQYESTASQDPRINSQKQKCMMYMYSVIQSYQEKMSCMNSKLESECGDLCKLIETVRDKLLRLGESVGKLDSAFRDVDSEKLTRHLSRSKCPDENSEEILERLLYGLRHNVGDAQSSVFRLVDGGQKNELLARKGQNITSLEGELNVIELILMNVIQQRNMAKKNTEIMSDSEAYAVAMGRLPESLMKMEQMDQGKNQLLIERN